MDEELTELLNIVRRMDTAILVTRGPDGHFHSRPMAVQSVDDDGVLWFATSSQSPKVADLEANPRCGVSFHHSERSATYASISGSAELVRDRSKIRELWNPGLKAWFPEGPEQGDLVLIRVQPEVAEYVHPKTGNLQVIANVVRRLVTHAKDEPSPKHHLELSSSVH